MAIVTIAFQEEKLQHSAIYFGELSCCQFRSFIAANISLPSIKKNNQYGKIDKGVQECR